MKYFTVLFLLFSPVGHASSEVTQWLNSFLGSIFSEKVREEEHIAIYERAMVHKREEEWREAEELFHKAMAEGNADAAYESAIFALAGKWWKRPGKLFKLSEAFQAAMQSESTDPLLNLIRRTSKSKNRVSEGWERSEELFQIAQIGGNKDAALVFAKMDTAYHKARRFYENGRWKPAKRIFSILARTIRYRTEAYFFAQKIRAEQGDTAAQLELGNLYREIGKEWGKKGEEAPFFNGEDYKERSVHWLERVAGRSVLARYDLGITYKEDGNSSGAVHWLTEAAEGSVFDAHYTDNDVRSDAMYQLAMIHEQKGRRKEAIDWLTDSTELGFSHGPKILAEVYARERNIKEAIYQMNQINFRKEEVVFYSAEGNLLNLSAFHKMALLHRADGNKEREFHWMRRATEQSNRYDSAVLARIELAKMSEEDGNVWEAVHQLQEAAEAPSKKGYQVLAKYTLALLFEEEERVYSWQDIQDPKSRKVRALVYMKEAAEARAFNSNEPGSRYALAAARELVQMYKVSGDSEQAAFWEKRIKPYSRIVVDTDPAATYASEFMGDPCLGSVL